MHIKVSILNIGNVTLHARRSFIRLKVQANKAFLVLARNLRMLMIEGLYSVTIAAAFGGLAFPGQALSREFVTYKHALHDGERR